MSLESLCSGAYVNISDKQLVVEAQAAKCAQDRPHKSL